MSHQEILVFQYKTLDKTFDNVMNQINILVLKSAYTEDPINI